MSTNTINYVRNMILEHFGTDSTCYDVIFTSGCTAALKMVGEVFPWTGETRPTRETSREEVVYVNNEMSIEKLGPSLNFSLFCYLEDNHTSVTGIREIAAEKGARLICIGDESLIANNEVDNNSLSMAFTPTTPSHLFAFPAQSNFNGRKYPLSMVKAISQGAVIIPQLKSTYGHWFVLLDAAGYVSTNDLNLSEYPAHFVTVSFYKLFGFPSGLGALLVRQDTADSLEKKYFGGGTVMASISGSRFAEYRPKLHER